MNWHKIITELQAKYTLETLARLTGFRSKGHLHDLKMGRQTTCSFERGQKLLELHHDLNKRKNA